MTYLSAMQEAAYLVGVNPPLRIDDPAPVSQRFRRMADRAGQEIARRADWNKMQQKADFIGDGGTAAWAIPEDYDRLLMGNPVYSVMPDGSLEFVRGSTSYDEWVQLGLLPQAAGASVRPRFFVISSGYFFFRPMPPPGVRITIHYIQKSFIAGATTENFTTNEQTTYFPERLLVLNMVWRWRRAQGAPFDDELKEYEADLAAAAAADLGLRPPSQAAA